MNKVIIEMEKLQTLIDIVTSAIHPKTTWIDINNFLSGLQSSLEKYITKTSEEYDSKESEVLDKTKKNSCF